MVFQDLAAGHTCCEQSPVLKSDTSSAAPQPGKQEHFPTVWSQVPCPEQAFGQAMDGLQEHVFLSNHAVASQPVDTIRCREEAAAEWFKIHMTSKNKIWSFAGLDKNGQFFPTMILLRTRDKKYGSAY